MTLTAFILLLAAAGIVLLAAELALPAHGILGMLGVVSILSGIAACFAVNLWTGLIVLGGATILSPLAGAAFAQLWPRTWLGRRLVLSATTAPVPAPGAVPAALSIGMTGVTVSELRPMGTTEFGDARVEVAAERGLIPSGTKVRIVAMDNGRPTVRVA